MPKIICVYKITSPSGRIYIGSTIDYHERITTYKRLDCKAQVVLYRSFLKYGVYAHKFEIIETCELPNVRQREAYYGVLYNSLAPAGLNSHLPKHDEIYACRSAQSLMKMGLTKVGNKNCLGRKRSKDEIEKWKAWRKANPNRAPHTKHTKNKMSKAALGENNHRAKTLLNLQTGIYYLCVMDAANSIPMNYNTFRSKLCATSPNTNNTPFIYV